LVVVSGEAGVGKTALLERFEQDLPDAVWAWGMCDGMFTPRPLGPLFDIAARLGGELLAMCHGGGAPREALLRALLGQIDVPGRLTVVVVEDVHWADEATLDLIRFLGRRLRGVPALTVATYRDDRLGDDDPTANHAGYGLLTDAAGSVEEPGMGAMAFTTPTRRSSAIRRSTRPRPRQWCTSRARTASYCNGT